jgi:hypothetical protein
MTGPVTASELIRTLKGLLADPSAANMARRVELLADYGAGRLVWLAGQYLEGVSQGYTKADLTSYVRAASNRLRAELTRTLLVPDVVENLFRTGEAIQEELTTVIERLLRQRDDHALSGSSRETRSPHVGETLTANPVSAVSQTPTPFGASNLILTAQREEPDPLDVQSVIHRSHRSLPATLHRHQVLVYYFGVGNADYWELAGVTPAEHVDYRLLIAAHTRQELDRVFTPTRCS